MGKQVKTVLMKPIRRPNQAEMLQRIKAHLAVADRIEGYVSGRTDDHKVKDDEHAYEILVKSCLKLISLT